MKNVFPTVMFPWYFWRSNSSKKFAFMRRLVSGFVTYFPDLSRRNDFPLRESFIGATSSLSSSS